MLPSPEPTINTVIPSMWRRGDPEITLLILSVRDGLEAEFESNMFMPMNHRRAPVGQGFHRLGRD